MAPPAEASSQSQSGKRRWGPETRCQWQSSPQGPQGPQGLPAWWTGRAARWTTVRGQRGGIEGVEESRNQGQGCLRLAASSVTGAEDKRMGPPAHPKHGEGTTSESTSGADRHLTSPPSARRRHGGTRWNEQRAAGDEGDDDDDDD